MVMADLGGGGGLATAPQSESGAAYRARQKKAFATARSHSRWVYFLRSAIPAGCVVAVFALVAFTFFNPFRQIVTVDSVSTVGISGSRVTMQLPKLSGYKKDLRSYDVTAETAVQDVKKPTLIELLKPDAKIELEKERYAHVTAETGLYDSLAQHMALNGGVSVKTDTGYDVTMKDAEVDLKAGNIDTLNPVIVKMSSGTITADSMQVIDNGKNIFFRGHVVSRFNEVAGDKTPSGQDLPARTAPQSATQPESQK